MTAPTIADIEAARERLAGVSRVTPLYPTETFTRLAGRPVLLKAENLQRTGSFKIRGAYNTISTLGDRERAAGVVAASAGNHGQAVAWAAREARIRATIFMPQDAPMAKVADDPELRSVLDAVQRRELDPLTAVDEIMHKVFQVDGADDR